jgi:hypothetical protein
MTSAEFKLMFPEFAASSYDARIATLLTMLPDLDEEAAGNQLDLALGNWVASKLAAQDYAITYGAGASIGSSNTVEKRVGDVSVKRSTSSSSSSSSSGGTGASVNRYEQAYLNYLREFGMGAQVI